MRTCGERAGPQGVGAIPRPKAPRKRSSDSAHDAAPNLPAGRGAFSVRRGAGGSREHRDPGRGQPWGDAAVALPRPHTRDPGHAGPGPVETVGSHGTRHRGATGQVAGIPSTAAASCPLMFKSWTPGGTQRGEGRGDRPAAPSRPREPGPGCTRDRRRRRHPRLPASVSPSLKRTRRPHADRRDSSGPASLPAPYSSRSGRLRETVSGPP